MKLSQLLVLSLGAVNASAAPRSAILPLFAESASLERPLCLSTGDACYTTNVTGKCCTGWCQCYLDPKTRRCRNTLGQCASN